VSSKDASVAHLEAVSGPARDEAFRAAVQEKLDELRRLGGATNPAVIPLPISLDFAIDLASIREAAAREWARQDAKDEARERHRASQVRCTRMQEVRVRSWFNMISMTVAAGTALAGLGIGIDTAVHPGGHAWLVGGASVLAGSASTTVIWLRKRSSAVSPPADDPGPTMDPHTVFDTR
jgi:hypothetical protein